MNILVLISCLASVAIAFQFNGLKSILKVNSNIHFATPDGCDLTPAETQKLVSGKSGDSQFKLLIKKYLDKFPHTLFRINLTKSPKFKLKEYKEQEAKGSSSYDFVAANGKICPLPSDLFSSPNGMSMRPNTQNEFTIISDKSGKTFILEIPAGTSVPDETVLVHEFGDQFSLQPAVAMDPEHFNVKISYFMQNPAFKVYTKVEWLAVHPIGSQITV